MRDPRLLITGVTTTDAIAYAVAERALLAGAHVTLTAPLRDVERCRAAAARLPRGAHVVLADLDCDDEVDALAEHLRCGYRAVDGVLHAGATGPASLEALARAVVPRFPAGGGALVALAPPGAGADPALAAAVDRLAVELRPAGARATLVVPGAATAPGDVAAAVLLLLTGGVRAPAASAAPASALLAGA